MFFRKRRKAAEASQEPQPIDPLALSRHRKIDAPDLGVAAPAEPVKVEPRRPSARKPAVDNALKTKLMGFDTSDGRVVELFEEDAADVAQHGRCSFPVGWVLVTAGPGIGECFALHTGMSQIGRGEDQAVRLDFGDQAISRTNHAAIVYDPKSHQFLFGHGGKANIVRLNGIPVVSTQEIQTGDEIEIGETRLRFMAFCSPAFNWTHTEEQEDDDDVEIA